MGGLSARPPVILIEQQNRKQHFRKIAAVIHVLGGAADIVRYATRSSVFRGGVVVPLR